MLPQLLSMLVILGISTRLTYSRTRYRTISFTVYQMQVVGTGMQCCNGYTRSESNTCIPVCSEICDSPRYCQEPGSCVCIDSDYHGPNCLTPICSNGCPSPRSCTAPNVCQCHPGLTGQDCTEDINECEASESPCEQICINTQGSHLCSCREGFTIGNDGERCVGMVSVSLVTVNSTALEMHLGDPEWDTEGLTSSYALTCSNVLNETVSTTVMSSINSIILTLNIERDYQCCATALTSNGNGSESCAMVSHPMTTTQKDVTVVSSETQSPNTEPTESSPSSMLTEQVTDISATDAQGGGIIVASDVLDIGLGVTGAVVTFILCLIIIIVIVCCAVYQSRYRKKVSRELTSLQMPIIDGEERTFHNNMYGKITEPGPPNKKSLEVDEELDYNNMYSGTNDNSYATVRNEYDYARY